MTSMLHKPLTPRAEMLLKALVERYIQDGEPVGSRTLSKELGLDLSPATIRNVMADLVELGLIRAPHTSAGRVPTPQGYRVFVDTLLHVRPFEGVDAVRMREELRVERDPQELVETASSLLAQVTRLAGVVMVPRREHRVLRQLEFLQLSGNRVLIILVTGDGRVQNQVITTARVMSPAELTEAANFFNASHAGRSLQEVRRQLLSDMERDSATMERAMSAAMDLTRRMMAARDESGELVVTGESNLFDIPDLGDMRKLRQLFDAFTTKRDLLHLLDQSMHTEGVQIFIGEESGYDALSDCSVVTAPYRVDGRVVGTLGVVGPTRMAYEQVISIVDVTARLLGAALSQDPRSG